MAVLQWTVRAVQLQSALSPVETALQTLHQPSRLLHANCGPAIANCGQAIAKCVAGIVMEGYMVAGRGGQQFKMLVLPSPDRPLLPGPRPEKKLEKVVGGSGENTLK